MTTNQVKPLRVAILGTRGIPARYGGFETFAEQIATRLCARGHRVLVYGRCSFFSRWGKRPNVNGVECRDTPTIFHKYLETPVHALTSFIDMLFRRCDVMLLCNAANSPLAPILRLKKAPLLINVDGIERNRAKWNSLGKLWYMLGERCSVRLASRVVSDAQVIADYYRETFGCDSVVIPYGVHPNPRPPGNTLDRFGLQPKRYILYVSRLEPENNALGVIQAYNETVKGQSNPMPLVIVGDAPYATEYKASLRQNACASVVFTGFQFGEAYEELQSNCYLYVQATEVGGTHPALIESMSYGNCVIANGTPENREVVGDAARCFSKNNFSELAAILKELLTSPQQVQELGARARGRVLETYSWDGVVSRYEALFEQLTSQTPT